MLVLDTLLKIKQKRIEKFSTTTSEYENFVSKLAAGSEVDLDRLAELLDELDKSDDDLQADVDAKQKRIEAANEAKRLRGVAATLPKLESEVKKLDAEIQAFLDERKPILGAAVERLRTAQRETENLHQTENILRTVGVPQDVQRRKAALQGMKRDRTAKRQEYESRTEHALSALRQLNSSIEQIEREMPKVEGRQKRQMLEDERSALTNSKLPYVTMMEVWQPLADEIAELNKLIDAESKAIEQALMVP